MLLKAAMVAASISGITIGPGLAGIHPRRKLRRNGSPGITCWRSSANAIDLASTSGSGWMPTWRPQDLGGFLL
jgi:hypothetical protein